MATGRDWQRLGVLVSERRGDLGMTQEDVRAAGGPSTATQRLIEGGHQDRYQPAILAREEKALEWQRGSIRRILAGGDPVPVSDAPAAPPQIAPAPVPQADDDAEAASSARIIALLPPHELRVWDEIRSHPPGTPADVIFADPVEAILFGRAKSELQGIREIAALRSVHAHPRHAREAMRAGLANLAG